MNPLPQANGAAVPVEPAGATPALVAGSCLFLDIDGVLNGHEWDDEAKSCNIRRECVARLNRVVASTGCKIVISSAWRYMIHCQQMSLTGFWYMLRTHGLQGHGARHRRRGRQERAACRLRRHRAARDGRG